MFAITGITGHVGRVAGTILLSKQQPVRAVVRNSAKGEEWKQQGAEVAIADLFDADSLTRAFDGAEGVFIMTPPMLELEHPIEQHVQMLDAIVTALKNAQPRKVVYLSSIGGHLQNGTGAIRKLYDMEQAFSQLSIPAVGIRAGWFMENFTGFIPAAISSGTFMSFLNPTNLRISMVAVQDIGKLAGELLTQHWKGHRIIELEGPQQYAADDVAAAIGRYSGIKIKAQPIPRKEYENVYTSFGFTANAARLMAEMNDGFNQEWIIFEGGAAEHVCSETTLSKMLKPYINK